MIDVKNDEELRKIDEELKKVNKKLQIINSTGRTVRYGLASLGAVFVFVLFIHQSNQAIHYTVRLASQNYERKTLSIENKPKFQIQPTKFFKDMAEDVEYRKQKVSHPSELEDLNWKKTLMEQVGRVHNVCGELCNINSLWDINLKVKPLKSEGAIFPTFTSNVDCDKLMSSEDIDMKDHKVPQDIPAELMSYFTMNGLIEMENYVYNPFAHYEEKEKIWTKKLIELKLMHLKDGYKVLDSNGREEPVQRIKSQLERLNVKGKHILVLGDGNDPWVEILCLHAGARKVTSLGGRRVRSHYRRLQTMTSKEFRESYFDATQEKFDGVVSYNAINHLGLGQYGEIMNPWGDIIATGRAWCATKPNGFMLLGLPAGDDKIRFNSHRQYGKYRWPLVATNWRLDDSKLNNFDVKFRGDNLFSFRKVGN